ncbi:alpha/beta fold hydrolase [Aeromicrobium chenweiae]|uniref:Alpha/beta hydrolase n=1 Tax=Aeromicrobium chenweiae TaxID=2079793 RepID=A0A2S0WLA6_9ACTN|nr:alpha/beta hydrolase [Aeromicrobium chenweiae]AWB92133.1 alpha/beta hydrolase [Aeromicrobium chenweiae]TGN32983.1 alpha/beta hydrolase [Aeromicrobium chenweiae]
MATYDGTGHDPHDVLVRNNVTVHGPADAPVLLLVHGFGCDQSMYSRVLPMLSETFRVVMFDHVGSGGSSLGAYDPVEYGSLDRYVADLLEICAALDLQDVTVVAHSIGAMMAIAGAVQRPDLLGRLVLLAPSPSYLDDDASGYVGGMSRADVQDLLESLDDNHMAWASAMAPVVMGNADSPELAGELEGSFCRVDPRVMRTFARVTFMSDVRDLLPRVTVPSLILQCSQDALAPLSVGEYLHSQLDRSELLVLSATGHVPQVSAPAETARAIVSYAAARQ